MASYFVYVSDTKLDMLYPQIPEAVGRRLSGELKIDFKVVGLSLKEHPSESTRYSKLRLVIGYLDRASEVGSLDASLPYIRAEMRMRWGVVGQGPGSDTVIFGGQDGNILVALRGSSKHVLGYQSPPQSLAPLISSLLAPGRIANLGAIVGSIGAPRPLRPARLPDEAKTGWAVATQEGWETDVEREVLEEAKLSIERMAVPAQKLQFVAKVLLRGTVDDQPVVIGSPIYVSLAE